MHPLKMPFCKVGFSVPKFKKRPYMPISKLKSYFANKYLSFSMTFPLRFKRTQNAFSYAVF